MCSLSSKLKACCDLMSISSNSFISNVSVTGSIFTLSSPLLVIFLMKRNVIIRNAKKEKPIKYISIFESIILQQIPVLDLHQQKPF